jgi:ribosomal protein S18 acetylase RimI-like enzyme
MPKAGAKAAALGVSYREAGDADLPFLAQVYFSTRLEEVATTGWPAEAQRAFLAQQFEAQHRHYRANYPDAEWLIISRGGEDIGRLYRERWKEEIRVIDIALLPERRRLGIGAGILEDVIAEAEAEGRAVSLHIEKNNPALSLYHRLGFVTIDERSVYNLMVRQPEVS